MKTIKDIAKHINVSETTVSLAFQPKSRISPATREKVLRAASQLNYIPNEAAKNLRFGGLNTIAIIVNDITNPFYSGMVRIVEMAAKFRDYQVLVLESQWDPKREIEAVNRIIQSRAQGAIICQSEKTKEGINILKRFKVPYVTIDTYPLDYDGPYVANDVVQAGILAAEHLVEIGCRKPALVIPFASESDYNFSAFVRLKEGFSNTLHKKGIQFGPSNIFNADLTIKDGFDILTKILNVQPDVDGILCGNDLCALGIIDAIDGMGMKVGRDIAVMGIDDLPISSLKRISLTSIQQPYEKISGLATEVLLDAIKASEPATIRKTMPPKLIKRDSTKRI